MSKMYSATTLVVQLIKESESPQFNRFIQEDAKDVDGKPLSWYIHLTECATQRA